MQGNYHGITFGEGKGRVSPNVQPDTRLNWSAVAELARPVSPVTRAPWAQLTHPQDPRERLTGYLDAWASMNEAEWPQANVKALYDDILDIFRDYPEAEAWYRAWRAAHPEARW